MGASGRYLFVVALLPLFLIILPFSSDEIGVTVAAEGDEQVSELSPGEVILIKSQNVNLSQQIDGQGEESASAGESENGNGSNLNLSGNSQAAIDAPHIVELHTATWCIPCRTAEAEVAKLETWWPAVETIALHSSLDSPDKLATNISSDVYHHYRLGGYPTIIVDGHWILMGETQSLDLQSLLGNLTENDRPVADGGDLTYSWQLVGENFTVQWNMTSELNITIDFLVTQRGVPWPGTVRTLDHVVRGGLSNLSSHGVETFGVNLSGGGDMTLTAVVRIAGNVSLAPGSDTPLYGGLPDTWSEPENARTLSPRVIAGLTIFLLLLAVIPMRHTLPLLWRRGSLPAAAVDSLSADEKAGIGSSSGVVGIADESADEVVENAESAVEEAE